MKGFIPFIRAPLSWSNHIPKAPLPCTITLRVTFWYMDSFSGRKGTSPQSVAYPRGPPSTVKSMWASTLGLVCAQHGWKSFWYSNPGGVILSVSDWCILKEIFYPAPFWKTTETSEKPSMGIMCKLMLQVAHLTGFPQLKHDFLLSKLCKSILWKWSTYFFVKKCSC